MEEFLTGPFFRYGIFPIASAVLGIAVKHVTRNDQYAKFTKEDLAVGLDLMRTACLLLVVQSTDRAIALARVNENLRTLMAVTPINRDQVLLVQANIADQSQYLTASSWYVTLMFFGLWSASTLVRKWGWKSATEMKPLMGIALPLALGLLSLGAVMAGAGR